MKKYIWLCCIILLIEGCNGGIDYPQAIEFRVEGTEGLAFWGSYGDTLSGTNVNDTVPVSYNFALNETEMAVCAFSKQTEENEADTLIVSLYVDIELFATETTTTYNTIQLFYPEYPE